MTTTEVKQNIPKGWRVATVEDVCENLDNLRKPVTKSDREAGDIPYYGATGIVDYVKDYIFDEPLLLIGEDGADWSKFANTAYTVDGRSWVNNHAHVLRCTKADRVFLKEYLNYEDLNSFITGGTRGKLTKGVLSKIPVLFPPLLEQKKIAEILGAVDEEIQKTDQVIVATEKLKRGMMRQLFSRGIGHTKFKKTKIGEIPKEWGLLKLKDVAKFTNGKAHEKDISENGKYIVINSKFISTSGQVIKRSDKNLSPLLVGDIAMVMSDIPKGKAFAKCFLVEENGKYTLNQRICSIKATKINNRFLYYILNRNEYFLGFDNGVGQTNLRKDEVLDCPVQLPSSREQNEIVEMLSAVDKKISVNKKMKEKLTLLKKGLMQDLLSGKKRTI